MTSPNAFKSCCAVLLLYGVAVLPALSQTFESITDFEGVNGSAPYSVYLAQGRDGNFYGTTSFGGSQGDGTVFKVDSTGTVTTLYDFCSSPECSDGSTPQGGLILASDGNYYGTTFVGGSEAQTQCEMKMGCGTVFKVTPLGVLTTLHKFCAQPGCSDGELPLGQLVEAHDGKFYGVTEGGGANGYGTIFTMNASGTITTLYNFCSKSNCADGYEADLGLIEGADGSFYGVTAFGGDDTCINGCGTFFKITSKGTIRTLHRFAPSEGVYPASKLVLASDGSFYGTAGGGGNNACSTDYGCGSVFKITSDGEYTLLHAFQFTDGAAPGVGVIQGTDGLFYGTTTQGGGEPACSPGGCGTIFQISANGIFATLHDFEGIDGSTSYDGMLQATTGLFYGLTHIGGDRNCGCGTAFSLDMGLGPFVTFVIPAGKVGQTGGILGQGFTGTTSVSLNGIPATFTVESDTFIKATVPAGATTGYVTVTTPSGTLTSNVPFHVIR